MGMATSTLEVQDIKKYTSAEIDDNLKKLFKNNGGAGSYSEASQTIGFRFNENELLTGGVNTAIKFNSSKNRHLRHNIEQFLNKVQTGGNQDNKQELDEQSEFAKIKEYLIKENQEVQDIQDVQAGGAIQESDYEAISSISGFNDFINTLSQSGGGETKKYASLASVLRSGQLGGDREDNLDIEEKEEEEKEVKDDSDEDLEDLDDSDDLDEDISSTSNEEVDIETANISPTSNQEGSASSGLNIIPFYSSSESSHAKPYTKNRLNK